MKVAYVCSDPGVPVFGRKGASVHVQAVLRVLAARGAELHVVAGRVGGPVPAGLHRVCVHRLPAVPKGDAASREAAARDSDAAVAAVLQQLCAERPLDLVYERYSLWGRTATAWASRAGVPSVLEVNAPLVEEHATHRELADRDAAEAVATAAFSAADVVACVSDEVAAWVRARGAAADSVHTVPNGVDTARVRPDTRPVAPAAGKPFTLGFVGTLKPWHGVPTLLEALALLDAADPGAYRLLLVGDGPERERLDAQATERGVAHLVEHTGGVAPDDVPQLLHRMDVGVAPYPPLPDFYFSPLKVYEYLAAGLPVVASRVGQVAAALDGGRLGVLVEPGDATALADAVAALRTDAPRRAALRSAGRCAAVERHSWEQVVDRVLSLVPATAAVAV